jgi:hypothetical protein
LHPVLFNLQQFHGFRVKAPQFFVLGTVLFHPLDGPVKLLAGVGLVPELPTCHGQEKPVVTKVCSVSGCPAALAKPKSMTFGTGLPS